MNLKTRRFIAGVLILVYSKINLDGHIANAKIDHSFLNVSVSILFLIAALYGLHLVCDAIKKKNK